MKTKDAESTQKIFVPDASNLKMLCCVPGVVLPKQTNGSCQRLGHFHVP